METFDQLILDLPNSTCSTVIGSNFTTTIATTYTDENTSFFSVNHTDIEQE